MREVTPPVPKRSAVGLPPEASAPQLRTALRQRIDKALASVDAIILPGAPAAVGPLKTVDKFYFHEDPIPNILANLTGHPALAFPIGKAASGMPMGLQLLGARGAEYRLLDMAAVFEKLDPDPLRLPPLYCR